MSPPLFNNGEHMTLSNDDLEIPYGNTSNLKNIDELVSETQNELRERIEDQYIKLHNIGTDLSADTIVSDEIYQDLLLFVDEQYIPIVNLDTILDNPKYTQLFGKYTYQFLIVDLLKYILPRVIKMQNLKSCTELLPIEPLILKDLLLQAIIARMTTLRNINNQSSNPQFQNELLKYTYFVDLVDNDISDLVVSFIHQMINQYDSFIDSTVI